MRPEYIDVWNEQQNDYAREQLMTCMLDGFTVRLTLQPGDFTAYHLSITPVGATIDLEVSNQGRQPKTEYPDIPRGVIVTVLNEDFAERSAHFREHEYRTIDYEEVTRRLGARNPCTGMAVVGTLRVIASGGVGTITADTEPEE